MSVETDLDLLTRAAKAAGEAAMGFFRTKVEVFWKNDGASPVTEADYAANDVLARLLRNARPDYGWLSEETEDRPDRLDCDRVFVIDPIDGTRAFMNGLPQWVVSVAVVRNGRPECGVLFAPATGELYQAERGGHVRKNGDVLMPDGKAEAAPLRVSGNDEMIGQLNARIGPGFDRQKTAPSLAYRIASVADGRLDATLVRGNAHDWDIAAAELILEMTGGHLLVHGGAHPVYNRPVPRHGRMVAVASGLDLTMVNTLSSLI